MDALITTSSPRMIRERHIGFEQCARGAVTTSHRGRAYVAGCIIVGAGLLLGCGDDDGPSAPPVTDGSGVPTTIGAGQAVQELEPGTNLQTPATTGETPGATGMIPGESTDGAESDG